MSWIFVVLCLLFAERSNQVCKHNRPLFKHNTRLLPWQSKHLELSFWKQINLTYRYPLWPWGKGANLGKQGNKIPKHLYSFWNMGFPKGIQGIRGRGAVAFLLLQTVAKTNTKKPYWPNSWYHFLYSLVGLYLWQASLSFSLCCCCTIRISLFVGIMATSLTYPSYHGSAHLPSCCCFLVANVCLLVTPWLTKKKKHVFATRAATCCFTKAPKITHGLVTDRAVTPFLFSLLFRIVFFFCLFLLQQLFLLLFHTTFRTTSTQCKIHSV